MRAEDGKLTLSERLRHRVTYFSLGVALGSRGFVDDFFEARRKRVDARRKRGTRPMRGGNFGGCLPFERRELAWCEDDRGCCKSGE